MFDHEKIVPAMESRINLARDFFIVNHENVLDAELIQMRDAIKRVFCIMRKKYGVEPKTIAIAIGWWEKLHEFLVDELGLSYCSKVPVSFGKPFATHFSIGWMDAEVDPIPQRDRGDKQDMSDKLPDIDMERLLREIEGEDEQLPEIDIAAFLAEENSGTKAEEPVHYVANFEAFDEINQQWIEYEFDALPNGALSLPNEPEILFAWVYGKVNKKNRMKKPRLAVVWKDQPRMVYTWPIYVDTLFHIIDDEESIAGYIASHLAVGEDVNHELHSFDEFAQTMRDKFNVDVNNM